MITLSKVITFEWDKGNSNKSWEKHQVSQREAEEVFLDPRKELFIDKKHSETETRYIMVGQTTNKRKLFVVFTMREKKVRIISARDLNIRKESDLYEKAA